MKIEEVLPALRSGKKIRRASWPKEVYFVKGRTPYDEKVSVLEIWVNENGTLDPVDYPTFYASDLVEEDWEVVEWRSTN